VQKKIPEESKRKSREDHLLREAEAILSLYDEGGAGHSAWVRFYHPELWRPLRVNRRKYKCGFKRHVTMLRMFQLVRKMLNKSDGAPVRVFARKFLEVAADKQIGGERTIRTYLAIVMKALGRDHVVRYEEGKGYIVSCPEWEAMKAKHGDMFDPPCPKRMERSHWLTKNARESLESIRRSQRGDRSGLPRKQEGTPAESCPSYSLGGFTGSIQANASTNGPAVRPRGRPRPRGSGKKPKPPAMRALARKTLFGPAAKPLPHCPRIDEKWRDRIAFEIALSYLCRRFCRKSVGWAVRAGMAGLDTALADEASPGSRLAIDKPGAWLRDYIKRELEPRMKRFSRAGLNAHLTEFWEDQEQESAKFEAQLVENGWRKPGQSTEGPLAHCREKLTKLAAEKAAIAAKRTAGKGTDLPF